MEFFEFLKITAMSAVLIALSMTTPVTAFAAPVSQINHITFLHTNDTHGFLTPYDTEKLPGIGGAAYRSTLINEIRRMNSDAGSNHHTMLVDAGDVLENNPMSNFFKGRADIEAMNIMGYEALTFGNHDFGFGMDNFLELEKIAKYPVISANILDRKTGKFLFKPYIVKNFGKLRVAIFGLTSHTVFYNSSKEDLDRITFLKPDEAYAKILPEMQEKSDLIIFLSHLGVEEDRVFAKAHQEIAAIIGGHSHTAIEKAEKIGNVIIVQAGKYGEYLGRLDLTVIGKKITRYESRIISVADHSMSEHIKKYKDQLDPQINIKIGDLSKRLDNMSKLEEPTPLFQFVLANLREYASADMAMETAASVGSRLDSGPIYIKDIYRIMPYNNFVVKIKMKGSEIQRLMDYSVSRKKSPFFIQTSGLTLDTAGPNASKIMINGEPLKNDKVYLVATDNYMAGGGAEDGVLNTIGEDRKEFTDKIIRDIIIENFKNRKAFNF
ncbi:MAG TPA: bifunctional UDP-sugar hydrolase/5'-nucleotidase [Candidatus Wallbacteria bacterium]|nr:bifunctional UDP-sugar hydrolase/5'-nucleotidase [Candidatus Wallbacteria bacterium]